MRSSEYEVLPLCIEKGISVLAYSPLQQGLLSGKYLNRGMKLMPSDNYDDQKPNYIAVRVILFIVVRRQLLLADDVPRM